MRNIGLHIGEVGELVELVGFAGVLFDEDDGARLIANEAEIVEIVKMHNFLAHTFINFIMLIR